MMMATKKTSKPIIKQKKVLPTHINSQIYIESLAKELKSVLKRNDSLLYMKTSHSKEIAPIDADFQFIRQASMLRKMYIYKKPIGTNRLTKMYKDSKNRGSRRSVTVVPSRGLTRKLLQTLEKAELIQTSESPKGRIISPKGHSLLDKITKKHL